MEKRVFHYADDFGYKTISSQQVWVFRASKPPGDHPRGAYFTTRLRIPNRKLQYVFAIRATEALRPLDGDRGAFIFYSADDYHVGKEQQIDCGPRQEVLERLS